MRCPPLLTSFTSATDLSATVPATDLASLGWVTISVSNPASGGGTSSAVPLSVYLVLNLGANHIVYDPYVRGVAVTWNGSYRTTKIIASRVPRCVHVEPSERASAQYSRAKKRSPDPRTIVKIILFPGRIGIDFANALSHLFRDRLAGAEGLVLDLRGNPGGGIGNLCIRGSEHLMRVSQERYTFTAEKNEFYVKDGWNADAERSARTLSGGESFLASLALALALAESVASFGADGSQAVQIDALFLDEGVSSLDQDDTLPAVIDGLSALQSGDRMVCVISHMENLAERLPARIEIVKNHGRSSLKATGTQATITLVRRKRDVLAGHL